MATATQEQPRCGSTDTGDGSPCLNMVELPADRCGHHQHHGDASDAVMDRDEWRETVEESRERLAELQAWEQALESEKDAGLAEFPQPTEKLDELEDALAECRREIERESARLDTLRSDVQQKVRKREAREAMSEAEDLAESIRAEAEDALPRAKDAVETLADTLPKILPAARRVRFIKKCLDELADLHDLDPPELDVPPSMYDLDDSGELDEIDPREIWEEATGANAQARNAGNVLTRSRRDGAELQDVISTRIENAREDWTD